MKRIAIFLRNSAENKFRTTILNTLRLPTIDRALLCSGFFQTDHTFQAGADFALLDSRPCSPLALTPLGIYSHTWRPQFHAFVADLRNANPCSCISVIPKRIPGMKWHAKVFIAKQGARPAVAIVGSSNITRRAFGAFRDFNRECDVVLWDETAPAVNRAVENAISVSEVAVDTDSGVIVASYDDGHAANRRPLADRIIALEEEILRVATDF